MDQFIEWETAMEFAEEVVTHIVEMQKFGIIRESRNKIIVTVIHLPNKLKRKSNLRIKTIPAKIPKKNDEMNNIVVRRPSEEIQLKLSDLKMEMDLWYLFNSINVFRLLTVQTFTRQYCCSHFQNGTCLDSL